MNFPFPPGKERDASGTSGPAQYIDRPYGEKLYCFQRIPWPNPHVTGFLPSLSHERSRPAEKTRTAEPKPAGGGLTTREGIGENAFLYAGGGVAQLGEHHVRNVGVEGSIPFSSTTFPFLTTNMHQGIEPASGADEQEG